MWSFAAKIPLEPSPSTTKTDWLTATVILPETVNAKGGQTEIKGGHNPYVQACIQEEQKPTNGKGVIY